MSRIVVVSPPAPVIDLAAAKQHLRVDHTVDDDLIGAAIATVTGHLDGPDGWLGWALHEQQLELLASSFHRDGFFLSCGPVTAIISVTYLDPENVEQALPSDQYDLLDDALYRRRGACWPATIGREGSVRIRYAAGPAPAHILAIVAAAAKLMVADLYRSRESFAAGTFAEVPMSLTVRNLLMPIRRWVC
jgi:uncharacterized phiE125 gp8 family phage protein